jgi:hypothetical protein
LLREEDLRGGIVLRVAVLRREHRARVNSFFEVALPLESRRAAADRPPRRG